MDHILGVPKRLLCWEIEKSFIVNHPRYIEAVGLRELRIRVQGLADAYVPRYEDDPGLGIIDFRYEANRLHQITVVHSYFINRRGAATRFIRLRRWGARKEAPCRDSATSLV